MEDTIYRQQAIDVINALHEKPNAWLDSAVDAVMTLPSAQSEITEDDVKEFCRKRCLIVVTSDLYDEMTRRWASAQSEIVRCKECKHWDTSWQNDYAPNYHYCLLVDGTRRDDFYCADAERRTDETD